MKPYESRSLREAHARLVQARGKEYTDQQAINFALGRMELVVPGARRGKK